MDLNARVDVIVDGRTDGWKTGRLYRTLLKQVWQESHKLNNLSTDKRDNFE